jgi:purine nucleosidase
MAWFGHEGQGILEGEPPAISQRDAVDVIIETLLAQDTEVVTLGPLSNLAAALDREPRIAERIPHLTVMGGFFHRCVLGGQVVSPTVDYNLNADQQAAVRALSTPIPTTYVPGDVTMRTALRDDHVRCLEESDDTLNQTLARLIRIWEPFQTRAFQAAGLTLPSGLASIPHDPLAVATLVDRRFVEARELPSTVAMVDGFVRTFIDPAAGRDVEVVTDVDAPAFAEFFLETLDAA